MDYNHHHNGSPVELTVVPDADWQTGLPTLLRFCIELHALLDQNTALALILFTVASPDRHCSLNAASEGIAPAIVRAVLDTAQAYPEKRFYRTASDSFALILPDTSRAAAMQLAEVLRVRLAQLAPHSAARFAVASAPQDAGEAGALMAVCEAQILLDHRPRVCAAMPVESLPPMTAQLVNTFVERMVALVTFGQQVYESGR